jgi:outer membrane immunogenic protein
VTGGGTVGLGVEVSILPNMFLRAEYEYVILAPVSGTRMNMQTGRVGIGMKF